MLSALGFHEKIFQLLQQLRMYLHLNTGSQSKIAIGTYRHIYDTSKFNLKSALQEKIGLEPAVSKRGCARGRCATRELGRMSPRYAEA